MIYTITTTTRNKKFTKISKITDTIKARAAGKKYEYGGQISLHCSHKTTQNASEIKYDGINTINATVKPSVPKKENKIALYRAANRARIKIIGQVKNFNLAK